MSAGPELHVTPVSTRAGSRAGRELLFLAPGDVSKGRVEPISWMRTCEAYAAEGLRVTLATLRTRRPDPVADDDIWGHFGVDKCFRLITFPTPLDQSTSVGAFRLCAAGVGTLLAATWTARILSLRRPLPIVHARAPVLLTAFAALRQVLPRSQRPLLVFESHALPKRANGWILRAADLVVVNSETLARDVRELFGLPAHRVLHAPLPPFNPVAPQPKQMARGSIGVESDAAVACYTGKMTFDHNEFLLATAAEGARRIKKFRLMLVGGNPQILDWTSRRVSELGLDDVVILTGFVPPVDVERYQAAADVLVYHMPETVGIFPYTTPAKAYEYQAMRRPIVATDFPLFAEVFGHDGERAIRVTDRTPHGFADGIASAFALEDRGLAMIERAASFVDGRTWSGRSAAILDALGV